jgi:hypothetical protein
MKTVDVSNCFLFKMVMKNPFKIDLNFERNPPKLAPEDGSLK